MTHEHFFRGVLGVLDRLNLQCWPHASITERTEISEVLGHGGSIVRSGLLSVSGAA